MLFDHPMIPCYLLKHPLTHLLPIGERERVRGPTITGGNYET